MTHFILKQDIPPLVDRWFEQEKQRTLKSVDEAWQDVNPETFSFQVLGEIAKRVREASTIEECSILFRLTSKVMQVGRTVCLGDVYDSFLEFCDCIHISVVYSKEVIAQSTPEPQGQVYFLLDKTLGIVKIGWSVDVYRRTKTIENQGGRNLVLLGAFDAESQKAESEIHRQFKHLRVKGEWFQYQPDLKRFIKSKLKADRLQDS